MPTIHTWKPTTSGYFFDATNYADGTAFAAGDTLAVNGGIPNAMGVNGNVEALRACCEIAGVGAMSGW